MCDVLQFPVEGCGRERVRCRGSRCREELNATRNKAFPGKCSHPREPQFEKSERLSVSAEERGEYTLAITAFDEKARAIE